MNRKELRQACWVSGAKMIGYRLHVRTPGINGVLEAADYHEAMAMQRAIRAHLSKSKSEGE